MDRPPAFQCFLKTLLRLLPVLMLASVCLTANAAPFTKGNVVIYRVGDGVDVLSPYGSPIYLDEYSPSGTLVQSIAMPTNDTGSSTALIASGVSTIEGYINTTADGHGLVFMGYNAPILSPPNTFQALPPSPSSLIPRTVVVVDGSGNIVSSTKLANFASGASPRAAASIDGTSFWLAGGDAGLWHTDQGVTTATQISNTVTSLRGVATYGNRIFVSTGAGSTLRLGSVGTGLPTTGGQTMNSLPGFSTSGSPYQFFMADLSVAVSGLDTLFVADDAAGVSKYSLVSGSWVLNGTHAMAGATYRGLTGSTDGTNIQIYAVRNGGTTAEGGGQLVKITGGGYNQPFSPTVSLLATAQPRMAFRGVANAPVPKVDLTIELSAPSTAEPNTNFNYVFTARNSGEAPANNVSIRINLPAGLQTSPPAIPAGFTYSASMGGQINFNGGTIPSGGSIDFVIPARGPVGAYFTDSSTAVIDPSDLIVELDESNNTLQGITQTLIGSPSYSPVITSHPAGTTIEGGNTTILGVTASASPSPSYQWYRGVSGNTSDPVAGATSSSFTTPQLNQTITYWVKVSNAFGEANSNAATVIVTPAGIPGSVIFHDDFNGTPSTDLHNLLPDLTTSGTRWVAAPMINADGNLDNVGMTGGSATLRFIPQNGTRYILQTRIEVTGVTDTKSWLAHGFVKGQTTSQGNGVGVDGRFLGDPTTGRAWMLLRANASLENPFTDANASFNTNSFATENRLQWADNDLAVQDGGPMDMRILLDTTGGNGNWKVTMYAKRVSESEFRVVRGTETMNSEDIGAVGVSISDPAAMAGSRIRSFTLSNIGSGTGSVAPIFTSVPGNSSIGYGATASLTVTATGTPSPTYQWYMGSSGDISTPVPGANSPAFSTPPLYQSTSFWVRASNIAGSTDSPAINLTVPSSNTKLSFLALGHGTLAPEFSTAINSYAAAVPHTRSTVAVHATTEDSSSTITVHSNGNSYVLPAVVPLSVGTNTIEFLVTSPAGVTATYQVTVTRAAETDLPVYRYDFNSTGIFPDIEFVNTTGRPQAELFTVTANVLSQHVSANGAAYFVFPDDAMLGSTFDPAKPIYAEARLSVGSISGHGASFAIANGSHYFRATFAPGGVYVGAPDIPANFVSTNLAGYHLYRIESPPGSNLIYFYIDGELVRISPAEIANAVNGFEFGDTNFDPGSNANVSWGHVEFGHSAGFTPPSTNANLANLNTNIGSLSPAFNSGISSYEINVPNTGSTVYLTPFVSATGAKVRIDGSLVQSGASHAIAVSPGPNLVSIVVTAPDLVTTNTYLVTINRALPMVVTTGTATSITPAGATLTGSANPNGTASVHFQYGTTTSYGSTTPSTEISGSTAQAVQSTITGLAGETLYHFRTVARRGSETVYGPDMTFTTQPSAPIAVTGNPVSVTTAGATLVGAVNPRGLSATVRFEYGLTTLYGGTAQSPAAITGSSITDVLVPVSGLIPNATYHYRIVATTSSGTTYGSDVTFVATAGGSGNGSPTAPPTVVTGTTTAITTSSVDLLGTVNPNGGTTVSWFEYGPTASYGKSTAVQGVGNVTTISAVSLPVTLLSPGTEYHYRIVSANSLGTSHGSNATFTTRFLPPIVSTGAATALTTTSVRVNATARARNDTTGLIFDYGTDPTTLNRSITAVPSTVTGDSTTSITADLVELTQGTTYYYRIRGENSGGSASGSIRSFQVAALSGLFQVFPPLIPSADHQASLTVNLSPPGIGGGWRLAGEQAWRLSGTSATGLVAGERVIEYRPVAGRLQPSPETVSIPSTGIPITIDRSYITSGTTGGGGVIVVLRPQSLAESSVPTDSRAQWRLFGENDNQWRDSGTDVSGLPPGNHVIEFKPVAGRTTPMPVTAEVADGATTFSNGTYFISPAPNGTGQSVVDFNTVSERDDLPYAWTGQLRGDTGSATGFVVRKRVVATAGHVVFDDGTLSAATGLQWLFQRDRGIHEPQPQIPRGYYLMTGYAAQRAEDDSPGTSTPASQNLDAAALYFSSDAGRGGYSGYLASDSTINEFIISTSKKSLVGYPINGISATNQGRLHATPPANVAFSSAFGRTYTTSQIHSSGGNSGGPLCILHSNGSWYPAAIFLGGTAQTVVRAIDSEITNLFGFAEASGNIDSAGTGGTGVFGENQPNGTPALGSLRVTIQPGSARSAGAGWRINPDQPYLSSGSTQQNIAPGQYAVQFPTISGFVRPTPQTVTLLAGQITSLTFTYEAIISPPTITSPSGVTGTRGQPMSYQITATNSPDLFNLSGNLPAGISFNAASGQISGTPQESGNFTVSVGASNAGGSDNKTITLSARPFIQAQSLTVPYEQPMSYQVVAGESGTGVSWSATNLPAGLYIDSATGVINGTPATPGVHVSNVTVSKRGASATASITFTITGTPPIFTVQPAPSSSAEFGTAITLAATATGLPAPSYQWYLGSSGNTASPVGGATSSSFSTPPLTSNEPSGIVRYWVRATSISGSADSDTSEITILPSSNADLISLTSNAGPIAPSFNPAITSYSLTVGYSFSSILLTPQSRIAQTTILINGQAVASGSTSAAIPLAEGANPVTIQTTAGNGAATRTYNLLVTRSAPPAAITGPAQGITYSSATLHGTVDPNGTVTYYFQYGRTSSYGNSTPPRSISGADPTAVQSIISGLTGSSTYHYRIAVITPSGTIYGDDQTFITAPEPPLVATGNPAAVTTAQATLTGGVNPLGFAADVHFQYGLTNAYGGVTPTQQIPAGSTVRDISATINGLIANATYHYRIVAITEAGTTYGENVQFVATTGVGGGDGIADSPPTVITGGVSDVTVSSAFLQGIVTPNDGTTFVSFEYGLTSAYGSSTASEGVGNGSEAANSRIQATGLTPGTIYHYRIIATNSQGTSYGNDATFTSAHNPPVVTTGTAFPLSPNTASVTGTVRANGSPAIAYFDYGTDGVNFPDSVLAFNSNITGDTVTQITAELPNLQPSIVYHFRVRAVGSGGSATGNPAAFRTGSLIGLLQGTPAILPSGAYNGSVRVNILPDNSGGWRFSGETKWRAPGTSATGLASGDRLIEYLPIAGLVQPPSEMVGVISGETEVVLDRAYYTSGSTITGGMSVTILPDTIASPSVPADQRARWRIAGDSVWKDSGETVTNLPVGEHLVEFSTAAGRSTPEPRKIVVTSGDNASASVTYFLAGAAAEGNFNLTPPASAVDPYQSYGYIGQIRGNGGKHTGFVVKRRVVVTAAQAVFDDATLSITSGIEWLFQRDGEVREPVPQTPKGVYILDGYASRRASENTPGDLSVDSRNTNVAALYFAADAGRGGFSGFLSSDNDQNEHLTTPSPKMLAGYPISGVAPTSYGRLHHTPPVSSPLTRLSGRTFITPFIRGTHGIEGAPLLVEYAGTSYLPAAIYVGGNTDGEFRAIDYQMIDLFSRAEVSANGGDNNTGGGITHTNITSFGSPGQPGAIRVNIEPAEARAQAASWNLSPLTSNYLSGQQVLGLNSGSYLLRFRNLAGFQPPENQTVQIVGGQILTVTYTYSSTPTAIQSWRLLHFGTSENSGPAADAEDADHDGQSNLAEFIAGTLPKDPTDVFKATGTLKSGNTFTLTIPGKAGRTYRLEHRADLTTGSWTTITTAGPLTSDGAVQLTDPSASGSKGFYRAAVSQP